MSFMFLILLLVINLFRNNRLPEDIAYLYFVLVRALLGILLIGNAELIMELVIFKGHFYFIGVFNNKY